MIMILFGALSVCTKTYILCRSDRHAFMSALAIHSSTLSFTISFQDDKTQSSTISRLALCNAASQESDKVLSHMIMILFGALSVCTKTYILCRSDRHAFMSALAIRSSTLSFTISFQDDKTQGSTISHLALCNAASQESDKVLSQLTLHGSLYFGLFAIRSLNLEFGMIERSPVITWPYGR